MLHRIEDVAQQGGDFVFAVVKLGELAGDRQFFGGLLSGFERGVTAMFGTSNARLIRKLHAW